VTSVPPTTKVSLLARAIGRPASKAARVGLKPATPTSAETTTSAADRPANSNTPSSPTSTSIPVPVRACLKSAAKCGSPKATESGRKRMA